MKTISHDRFCPLSDTEIFEIVKTQLLNSVVDPDIKIEFSSRLDEDLGLDQVATGEALDMVEETFTNMSLGFRIDMIERNELETVLDILKVTKANICHAKKDELDD